MVSLSAETQRMIEERMKETGVGTPDELVQIALQTLRQIRGENFEDLDPATQAAIEEGLSQADRGETRPWDEVRKEIQTRFIDKRAD
jgi:predicted transcriptional regulator